jgi:hypothetical protein
MLSCARATPGHRKPSPGLMARPGVPVGGRVRKLRAVGAPLACPQRRRQKSSGCSGGKTPDHFFSQLSFANPRKYFHFIALPVDCLNQKRYFSVVRRRIFLS